MSDAQPRIVMINPNRNTASLCGLKFNKGLNQRKTLKMCITIYAYSIYIFMYKHNRSVFLYTPRDRSDARPTTSWCGRNGAPATAAPTAGNGPYSDTAACPS